MSFLSFITGRESEQQTIKTRSRLTEQQRKQKQDLREALESEKDQELERKAKGLMQLISAQVLDQALDRKTSTISMLIVYNQVFKHSIISNYLDWLKQSWRIVTISIDKNKKYVTLSITTTRKR